MANHSGTCTSKSTIGLKVIMAVTGTALFLFTLVHMLGNLQVFTSSEAINHYAHKLQSLPPIILWGFRLGLLMMVALHIFSVILLVRRNRQAKPGHYVPNKAHGATIASRTMAVSGVIVLTFIIFHLWHFSIRGTPFTSYEKMQTSLKYDGELTEVPNVYQRIVTGFSNPFISIFYLISVGLLCLHMSHGIQSAFRTLGGVGSNTLYWQAWLGRVAAFMIFAGMAAVPLSVLLGILK